MINRISSIILILFLAGCAGGQAIKTPPHEQAALDVHLRGTRQLQSGELEAARMNLVAAYKLFAAVEHRVGSSATLINLASLERRSGNYRESALYLSQADSLAVTTHQGQIAYEQALLALASTDLASAERSAREVLNADPSLRGAAHNLIARIHFISQDYEVARKHVDQALNTLPDADLQERANAYRLRGKIDQVQAIHDAGVSFLEKALKMDQQLKRADKIALDLKLLADSHRALENWKKELNYLRRLYLVEMNSGENEKGSATLELMATRLEARGLEEQANELRTNAVTFNKLGVMPTLW
ncbi:MAG: hypothetical protein C0623_08785 [Desulfuromonas sp.]|nr:MAG: hypothetical protein C0623_08785 [Desulfuromonas sp.]